MENSIRQGTILLNDNKMKNENLKQKIIELENKNKELNYKLIETNQKMKRLQANINNKNFNVNINEEINKLNNIIDENEIKISKLELDKKNLEQKLDEAQKSHANEIKLMLDYKNSELSIYQNILDKYKADNNGNNPLISNNPINNDNLSLRNVQIQINKMKQEIAKKNNIINALNNKITQFNADYNKKLLELKQSSDENINQTQEQVEQLIIERDELLRKNESLTKGLMQFNEKVNEVNLIYNQKLEFFNKSTLSYNEKIKEYKLKIISLKKKIDELYNIIKKYRMNKSDIYNNYYNLEDKCSSNRYKENNNIIKSPYASNNRDAYSFTDVRNNNRNNCSLTYERNGNDIDKEFVEDQLDLSQKKYLENYKNFLSNLDEEINK
jgi:chromosome segregation ATPase